MLFEFQNLLIVTKKSNKVQFQYIKHNQYRKYFFNTLMTTNLKANSKLNSKFTLI